MRSAIRRLANQASGPPVPLSPRQRSLLFNIGGGAQDKATFLRTYQQSGTIYSIVSLLAQAAAGPKWRLFQKQPVDGRRRYATSDTGDDQRKEVTVHAALQLWNKPNDFHSGFEFREGANQHEELTGETIWVLNRENGLNLPTSMWYVRPDRIEPIPDPDDFLVGWVYTAPDGSAIPLKLDEVIMERLPDPMDPFRGAGPVGAILPNIQQQRYATDYQRNLFLNGADPGSIIQFDGRMTDREFDEFTDRWREGHQGVARAGRVGILENGATWLAAASATNKDMEYSNLRLQNRDELREAWRMHKSMLGTVEDVNRANAQTAEEVFVAWSEKPRLDRRKETLNTKLLPMFYPANAQIPVEFDYDDPSPVNQEAAVAELLVKAQAAAALVDAGYDQHDVLEVVGLPDMDVDETATQQPALPPGWVAPPPAGGTGGGAAGGDSDSDSGDAAAAGPQSVTLTRPRNDAKSKVLAIAAADYPAVAMAWMYHAQWTGPVNVPLGHIDPEMPWMDDADPAHVQDFVERREAGRKLKPVLLVKTPGNPLLELVDGHHRYLAEAELKEPVRSYVGTVSEDTGPWQQMHSQQQDTRPGNRFRCMSGAEQAALVRQVMSDGYVPVQLGRA